ncbi:lysylphosphatidylglycerol synthase domain-containing protein (plasmid) [Sinorhizobium meliloti]|uniref:lysylphosphatidylglycerol synthase domain-containing protein n=1 Tax=Rhizobium meliloti TaxID=382 RepID=UPI002D77FD8D|nr:lysylphosphatidylglycerol synthase domain-containing protein [Sinorhizobium meliloti]WRQ70541.1 lysylphosphatidylglycerol synthase domain-containing protein [Sinorhizobium meliloti]
MSRKILARLFIAAGICVAGWLIYRTLSQHSFHDIVGSIMRIPARNLLLGIGFVFLSYFCLTLFDTLAIRYVGRKLAYPQIAIASFTSLSIGHNVGGAALSSGAVRYRFYSRWGLSAEEVAKVILFCGVTVGLGLVTLAGLCFLVVPAGAARLTGFSTTGAFLLGTACIAAAGGYVLLAYFLRGSVRIFRWTFEMPSVGIAALQVVVGVANFLCVSAALHQLLSAFQEVSFIDTAMAYVGAGVTAIVSHVPGGIGVLEATIAFLLGSSASLGALIAFRAIYFFLPLPLGLILLSVTELVARRDEEKSLASKAKS